MNKPIADNTLNFFAGKQAVRDFLDPEKSPYTPLVEIPEHLNPYHKYGVCIFAKLMNALPLTNVKSLPALNMLMEAEKRGDLAGVDTVIENSSGNTVLSLAVVARLLGIHTTKAVVSHQVSRGKLNLLRFLGTEVIVNEEPICPDPNDQTSGIYKSKQWAKEHHWFNPGQYDNPDNPNAHYKWTGPQIWQQTRGKVDLLSVGLGTTGSAVGISKYLKEQNPDITTIGISRIANNPVPGVRTNNLLKEIAFDWSIQINHQEEIGTAESFKLSLELCRAGIFAGPSSGFALAGLLQYLSKQELSPDTNLHGKVAVFICPDSPLPYIDEYFEFLDDSDFPSIQNAHLLQNQLKEHTQTPETIQEVSPLEAFEMLFEQSPTKVWEQLNQQKEIILKKGIMVIDTRSADQFEDHHIPNAINVPLPQLDEYLDTNRNNLAGTDKVLFVCRRGNSSRVATQKAQRRGINSYSLSGGDTEWSRLDLPRVRADRCVTRYGLDTQTKS
jgi:cysteine synthase/rhodanese-related sulfurtransferase